MKTLISAFLVLLFIAIGYCLQAQEAGWFSGMLSSLCTYNKLYNKLILLHLLSVLLNVMLLNVGVIEIYDLYYSSSMTLQDLYDRMSHEGEFPLFKLGGQRKVKLI